MSNPKNQDPGWDHGTPVLDKGTTHVRCKYCDKITKGGIYRHKLHLVGGNRNVMGCKKCPQIVRDAMKEYMLNKKQRKEEVSSTATMGVQSKFEFDEEGDEGMDFLEVAGNPGMGCSMGSSNKSIKGPMDLYFNTKEHQSLKRSIGGETVTLEACKKDLRERAMVQFSRWMYEAGLPFNCVQYTKSLKGFIECVAQHGPGMKPPSYHEVRVPYLKKEVEHVKELFKPHEETCNKYGCSLMMDKWTDRRGIPEDANDELVFEDGDGLTWGEIAKFSGANETPYSLRHTSKRKEKVGSSSSRRRRHHSLHICCLPMLLTAIAGNSFAAADAILSSNLLRIANTAHCHCLLRLRHCRCRSMPLPPPSTSSSAIAVVQ
nr:uncharacterized protein LOC109167856 [Ipomoea batatas]